MTEADPEYEERLRRRLELLRQQLEEGKISFSAAISDEVANSLSAVRSDAKGQVDLATVDSVVRSLAVAVEGAKWREDLKSANSLRDINEEYFRFINVQFAGLYEESLQRGLSVHEAAIALSSSAEYRASVCEIIPEFVEQVREFWAGVSDPALFHLQDFRGLKAVFGGDLFPPANGATVRTSAVYADTAILPDPFLQSDHLFQRSPDHLKAYYFFKAALSLCSVARLALADLDPPIVCILPHPSQLSESVADFLKFEMERLGLLHAGKIFGREFETVEEFWKFGATLATVDELSAAMADPSRLLFDTEFVGSLDHQLAQFVQGLTLPVPNMTPGQLVGFHCSGRMSQASGLLLKSREIHGVPLIDAPTSWAHFRWCLEYLADTDRLGRNLVDEHTLHALAGGADTPIAWLGGVPEDALIEMRTTGGLHEVREKLAAGLNGVVQRGPDDFISSSARVYANIDEWMREHQAALRGLRNARLKFAGVDVATCVVYGAIEIASAIGVPGISLVNTFLEQTVGTPKLADLPAKYSALQAQAKALSNSTAGVFFGAKNSI